MMWFGLLMVCWPRCVVHARWLHQGHANADVSWNTTNYQALDGTKPLKHRTMLADTVACSSEARTNTSKCDPVASAVVTSYVLFDFPDVGPIDKKFLAALRASLHKLSSVVGPTAATALPNMRVTTDRPATPRMVPVSGSNAADGSNATEVAAVLVFTGEDHVSVSTLDIGATLMTAVRSTLLGLQGGKTAFPGTFLEVYPAARGVLVKGVELRFMDVAGDPGPNAFEPRLWPFWQPLMIGIGGVVGVEILILLCCLLRVAYVFFKARVSSIGRNDKAKQLQGTKV